MRRHLLKKLLASALGLIVLGCIWFYFAPTTLGGSTSYVVTHGISMEPLFHTGDLAIVRGQPRYRVGEIVAYHNKMLHVIALHRIVGREGERYIFKGDNNNFIDPEHPRASQLIGALWIHIRGGGTILQTISSPARVGLLIALGMLLFMGGVFTRSRRRRHRERREGNATPRALPSLPPLGPSTPATAILAVGVVVSLPFLMLALLAFTSSASTRRAVQIPYTQSGTLSYSAYTAPNQVYPAGVARTGEPLFTELVNDVNLRFGYKFATKSKHALAGKGSFQLLLTANDGWHRTLQLGSPTHFRGDHATITGTLDLNSLLALARSVEAATHVASGYTFAVVPTVLTSGNVEGVPVHATFAPTIQFSVNSGEVSIQGAENRNSLLTGAGTSHAAGPLTPSAPGSATGEQSQPRSLSLGPLSVSVSTARMLALSAIGVILAAVLAILALIRPLLALIAPRRDEAASILARYRGLIVPVAQITPLRGVPVIDVGDMDALARIAEHYDRSILHETTVDGDAFWVTDESGQFRYTVGRQEPRVAQEPPVAARVAPDLTHDFAASHVPTPVAAPTLEMLREPAVVEPEPVVVQEPVVEPEPVAAHEPVAEPEPEPVPTAEPAVEPEPVAAHEPAVEPEPVAAHEPAVEPEPVAAHEPAVEPEPEPAETPAFEYAPSTPYEPATEELPVFNGVHDAAPAPAFTAPYEPVTEIHPPVEPSTNGHHRRKPIWASDDQLGVGTASSAEQQAEDLELYAEVYADELELGAVVGEQPGQPSRLRRDHPSRVFGSLTGSSS
jgi:signal peptidase I